MQHKNRVRNSAIAPDGFSQPENKIPNPLYPFPDPATPGKIVTLPHPPTVQAQMPQVTPPKMESVTFKTTHIKALKRLFVWIWTALYYILGNLKDKLYRQSSEKRRAARLRRAFEKAGGTFPKFGQQISMRIDLLPWSFCMELSKMLDKMPPFEFEHAIKMIEKNTGEPMEEVFSQFDPNPIGAASISCVYQAHLKKNGEKVAVKVRRPQIGEIFMADLKVLDWIFDFVEFLSIVRPGFTKNLRQEFKDTLLEELDFRLEARYQGLFRRAAKKSGKKFFTAPKVYFEYSGNDVIVQEFVSGVWMWEVIAAVEQKDEAMLTHIESLNIDPKKVAERLLWVNYWGLDEYLFFHADPHPANIVIQPNSKLAFIDFGSVGALDREKQRVSQQVSARAAQRDPLGMAQAILGVLEPLPPIDVDTFTKELEATNWNYMYTLETKEVEWWERTSASIWLGVLGAVQKHQITINLHLLRMVRASLLYDTLAARLYSQADRVKEYKKFFKYRAKRARKRAEKRAEKRYKKGLDDQIFVMAEELATTADRMLFQLHRFLDKPAFRFNAFIGKSVFTISTLIQLIGRLSFVTGVVLLVNYAVAWISNSLVPEFWPLLTQIISHPAYLVFLIFLLFINIRRILFRYGDKVV